ncbi:hypothetical protein [Micromonospora sp. NPDC049799]|uniref:hypothetical protein n=1 Tax=Micromonospora sp. NPDC049799 TaxID=3154741 RepID=UPI003404F23F
MLFDLLADASGEVILNLPLTQRRARLQRLLADTPAQLTLTPQTTSACQFASLTLRPRRLVTCSASHRPTRQGRKPNFGPTADGRFRP